MCNNCLLFNQNPTDPIRKYTNDFLEAGNKIVTNAREKWEESKPDLQRDLGACLDALVKVDRKSWFLRPVVDALAADPAAQQRYLQLIPQPMCLDDMRLKVAADGTGAYKDFDGLRNDLLLVCDNCVTFNGPASLFSKEAERLRKQGLKEVDKRSTAYKDSVEKHGGAVQAAADGGAGKTGAEQPRVPSQASAAAAAAPPPPAAREISAASSISGGGGGGGGASSSSSSSSSNSSAAPEKFCAPIDSRAAFYLLDVVMVVGSDMTASGLARCLARRLKKLVIDRVSVTKHGDRAGRQSAEHEDHLMHLLLVATTSLTYLFPSPFPSPPRNVFTRTFVSCFAYARCRCYRS